MTEQQFVIDLGDQRALVEPDDAGWLQEKLRKEPGSTRLTVRYDEDEAEGHGPLTNRIVVIAEGDDDTEGHAIAINFPTREEADAFRKRLMVTGVLAGTIALGALGGVGLANLSSDAGAGAVQSTSQGSAWTQDERAGLGAAASDTGTGSAWTQDERPGSAVIDTSSGSAWTQDERPGSSTVSDTGGDAADSSTDEAPSLGGPTPR